MKKLLFSCLSLFQWRVKALQEDGAYFVVEKKSHKNYYKKRVNHHQKDSYGTIKFYYILNRNERQEHHNLGCPRYWTQEKSSLNQIILLLNVLTAKDKINKALELLYSNEKLKATNNFIKIMKRNAFGFRNFKNFKTRILITLNIKKERTSQSSPDCNFSSTHQS